jgi:hypothetical protein
MTVATILNAIMLGLCIASVIKLIVTKLNVIMVRVIVLSALY